MMIDKLIEEINQCLKNGCVMAALTLTLTLPDICGKVLHPNLGNRKRYVSWFDEYIGQYESNSKNESNAPCLSGDLIYLLRCSMLHEGNPNVDSEKTGITYFELIYNKNDSSTILATSYQAEIIKDKEGNDEAINKKYSVNVKYLCWKICTLAKTFYDENKEKFNFFNYNLVSVDFRTKEIFHIK